MVNLKNKIAKIASLCLTMILAISSLSMLPVQASQATFTIVNPYENVNWATTGQYRAAHHTHTTFSDGSNTRLDMLIDLYNKGFDIVAITDHDTTTVSWDALPYTGSWNNNWEAIGTAIPTTAQMNALRNGTFDAAEFRGSFTGRRQQFNGMISMGASNEISAQGGFVDPDGTVVYVGYHINAFFAQVPGDIGLTRTAGVADADRNTGTMREVLQIVQDAGGLTHLNHPGRYTGAHLGGINGNESVARDPVHVARHVSLFMEFPSLVGMEIINKWDGESRNDRIFWDQILMQTMPQGRPVWGFSNDDSHMLTGNGHAWNVMLMPELTEEAVRESMVTGAFYGVTRVDRRHGINHRWPDGTLVPGTPPQTRSAVDQYTGGTHNNFALQLLAEPTPSISNIIVDGSRISIQGRDFHTVIWIADGEIVHIGNMIDVSAVLGINSYIRAELIGAYGVAYTQPFGIIRN